MADERKETAFAVAVGRRMRQIRKARGLTMEQAAERAGIEQGTLSRYEAGKRWLSDDVAQALAEAYECPPESFYVTEREAEAAAAADLVSRMSPRDRKRAIRQLKALTDDED